jgi:hypothetical protein
VVQDDNGSFYLLLYQHFGSSGVVVISLYYKFLERVLRQAFQASNSINLFKAGI